MCVICDADFLLFTLLFLVRLYVICDDDFFFWSVHTILKFPSSAAGYTGNLSTQGDRNANTKKRTDPTQVIPCTVRVCLFGLYSMVMALISISRPCITHAVKSLCLWLLG